MIIRKAAQGDSDDILAWRNDPVTRAMSRSHDVIRPSDHMTWFTAALADPRRTLLIGDLPDRKVGMVRLDHGETSEVSINLNPLCRGQGLALPLLSLALADIHGTVEAEVHDRNLPSLKLFERAGFILQGSRDGWCRFRRDPN